MLKYLTIIILFISCYSPNLDNNYIATILIDDVVINGISKFRFQKDHWNKREWKIGLIDVIYNCADERCELNVNEINKKFTNIDFLAIDVAQFESLGIKTTVKQSGIKNALDAIFVFYKLSDNKSSILNYSVKIYWTTFTHIKLSHR